MSKHPIGSDPLDDIPTRAVPSKRKRASNTDRKRSTSTASTADRKRSTSRKTVKPASSEGTAEGTAEWDASHVRVTFYCPVSLLGQVESEITRSGRSKTRVIVDAIQSHLKAK